jgi:hypothetical protein
MRRALLTAQAVLAYALMAGFAVLLLVAGVQHLTAHHHPSVTPTVVTPPPPPSPVPGAANADPVYGCVTLHIGEDCGIISSGPSGQ